MEKIYKYKLGRKVIYSSVLYMLLVAGLSVQLAFIYEGGYISAWFISLILAILTLMILSIPRRVVVDEEGLEIQCIAEDTTFAYEEIAGIRKVENREMNACVPIFGAVGFFASSVFSIIYSMALQVRPEKANQISGLMITAVAGGGVVSPVIGFAIGTAGVIGGVFVTLACVCYLTYCAFGVKTAKA